MPSGIRVQRLDLPIHQPGQQEIALDLSDDPPGIYILRMNIANKIITRKMVKY
jgi:hypothetical protein